MIKECDILIVGGGPAGLAAACAAYDAGCKNIIVAEREATSGGILKQCIHPGFGLHAFGKELTGPEYANIYKEMIKERGITVLDGTFVISVSGTRAVLQSKNGVCEVKAKAVILAMGCRERPRGAINVPGTRPSGIYTAGAAQRLVNIDGYMPGKRAVILGSGDIGLIMARRMTLEGAKVEAVLEILPYSGGLARNIEQCLNDFGIPLYLSHTVTEIHGKERLTGVTVAEVDGDRRPIPGTERFIECDTLLLSVGLIPENELTLGAGIELDRITGGATVDENRMTSENGVFSCGNVLHVHDLVDHVSEEAKIAGTAAAAYASGAPFPESKIRVKAGYGIRYTVPQRISGATDTSIYMRVTENRKNAKITAYAGELPIAELKVPRAAPGEMIRLKLKCGRIPEGTEEITVRMEEPAV